MKKIDATVISETKYIGIWVLILSLMMESVFLVIGKWDYTVLLGNVLSGFFAVLNFLLMGITVQKAVTKDEKEARSTIKVSQIYRNFMLVIVAAVGLWLNCFNGIAVIIPLFFPRIAVAIRPLFKKD